VAVGQSQRFYSGVGVFNWYYLSSPPQNLRVSEAPLESGGLIFMSTLVHRTSPISRLPPLDLRPARIILYWHFQVQAQAQPATVELSTAMLFCDITHAVQYPARQVQTLCNRTTGRYRQAVSWDLQNGVTKIGTSCTQSLFITPTPQPGTSVLLLRYGSCCFSFSPVHVTVVVIICRVAATTATIGRLTIARQVF
jgi:hypothetical protein